MSRASAARVAFSGPVAEWTSSFMETTLGNLLTDRSSDVQAWLEPRADEMAALLEELVAIDTENPPGRGLGRCGRVLRDAIERIGLAPELIEVAPHRDLEDPCIVRAGVGDGPRTIYFHGHFDVVPAQDREQFRPQRRDGRIT